MKCANFFALRRSGQHAIIFWMLNNMGCNLQSYIFKGVKVFLDEQKKVCYLNDDIVGRPLHEQIKDYKFIIKNFEDKPFFEEASLNLTIVRDFLNTLCSRNAHFLESKNLIKDFDKLVFLWKDFVKRDNIIYNRWVLDKEYRDKISDKLSVKNMDNVDFVPVLGGGSSFLGNKLEINKKNYLKRYKKNKLPKILVEKIFSDPDLLYLNKEIFDINIKKIYKILS